MSKIDKKTVDSYVLIDNAVIERTDLTPSAKLTYIALTYYATLFKNCYPSFGTIARIAGISRSSVIRGVVTLEAAGLIGVNHRELNSNEYYVYDNNGNRIMPGAERKNFLRVDWGILSMPCIPSSTKMVYLGLLRFLGISKFREEEGCHPSFERISKICGLSKRAVIDNIALLQAGKIVEKLGKWAKSNWYMVVEKLSDAEGIVQVAIEGFFKDRTPEERKKTIAQRMLDAKQAIKNMHAKHKQETAARKARESGQAARVLLHPINTYNIDPKWMQAAYEAIHDLLNRGTEEGVTVPGQFKEEGRVWIKGDEVRNRMNRLTVHHVLAAMERIGDQKINRLTSYIKTILVGIVNELPSDYVYNGYLVK